MKNKHLKELKNGMKVMIESRKGESENGVQIGFYVLGGKYTETTKSLQHYHFLEHLLSNKLKKYGGDIGVTASEYHTHVYMKGVDSSLMLNEITQLLTNFEIDKDVFNQEKKKIQSELDASINKPFSKLKDKVNSIFGQNHISGVSIKKQLKAVDKITLDDMVQFVKHAMIPSKTVFYMIGNVPKYNIYSKYKKLLEQIPNVQPVFSISRLEKWKPAKIYSDGTIYYIKQPSITTRLNFRWRIPVTLFDNIRVSIVDAIVHLMHTHIMDNLGHFGCDLNIHSFLDPINHNLSYISVQIEAMTKNKSKHCALEIIRFLTDPNISNIKQLEDYKQNTQQNTQKHDSYFNIPRVLWDEPQVQKKVNTNKNKVDRFFKKYLTPDKTYFVYSGPHDLFM